MVTEFVPRLGNITQPVTRLRGCAEERELQTGLGTQRLGRWHWHWTEEPGNYTFCPESGAGLGPQLFSYSQPWMGPSTGSNFYKSLILCGSDNPPEIAAVNAINQTWVSKRILVLNKEYCSTKDKHWAPTHMIWCGTAKCLCKIHCGPQAQAY